MAGSDVKVKEVRLLESYFQTYNRFMESMIMITHKFPGYFSWKEDEARDFKHKIEDHLSIARQKLEHAKNAYEASLKRGGGMDGKELAHREQALEKYKALYQKAQKYAESAKKICQNIHGETVRVRMMSLQQRQKIEKSREEGCNFLNKAISALSEYKQ